MNLIFLIKKTFPTFEWSIKHLHKTKSGCGRFGKKSLIENRIINKNELINIDENNDDGIYIKKRSNKDELKNNSNIQKSNKKFLSSTASANTE